jgi:hypothetical protein
MTAHWYSFGDCTCEAHTILEIRVDACFEPSSPACPVCGETLRYRGHWPAPDDGFGGSSGGLDEIIGRALRVVEKHPEDRACVELGVALDAWAAQRMAERSRGNGGAVSYMGVL